MSKSRKPKPFDGKAVCKVCGLQIIKQYGYWYSSYGTNCYNSPTGYHQPNGKK